MLNPMKKVVNLYSENGIERIIKLGQLNLLMQNDSATVCVPPILLLQRFQETQHPYQSSNQYWPNNHYTPSSHVVHILRNIQTQ